MTFNRELGETRTSIRTQFAKMYQQMYGHACGILLNTGTRIS